MEDIIIEPFDTIQVILYALFTTVFAEFGMWLLIYNKDEFKNLKKDIEKTSVKLNKQKEEQKTISKQKSHEKKVGMIESQFKELNQRMTTFRLKSTFLIGIFMIIILSSFGTVFQGITVAKLPFQPIFFIRGLTHRGLLGEDYTECSYIFIYVLTAFVIRQNIQKIFGFEPPRACNSFFLNPAMQPPKF